MRGVLRYRREDVVAILDSERAGETKTASRSSATSRRRSAFEPQVALVGVATQGGRFPPAWRALLAECIRSGLSLENGLHQMLRDDPELRPLADEHGVELRDLRRPPDDLDCPTGANLEVDAPIVLTVGSDCAIGKMTVSLELDRAARRAGIASVFVPTGQTGIAIAGWGIAVDAVVSDFLAGAAERLVVEGRERGGELLLVEGQGSLVHPAYSGVTLGLFHGSAPHALVLCHRPGTTEVEGYPGHPLPSLPELVSLHERIAAPPPRTGRRGRAEHRRARRRRRGRSGRVGGRGDGPPGRRSCPRRRRRAARRSARSARGDDVASAPAPGGGVSELERTGSAANGMEGLGGTAVCARGRCALRGRSREPGGGRRLRRERRHRQVRGRCRRRLLRRDGVARASPDRRHGALAAERPARAHGAPAPRPDRRRRALRRSRRRLRDVPVPAA